MAMFAQYAVAAAQQAIEDAGIQNLSSEERETVVCASASSLGYG
jgi:3-oxoacyl-(acyl-carrier-protein) synthase